MKLYNGQSSAWNALLAVRIPNIAPPASASITPLQIYAVFRGQAAGMLLLHTFINIHAQSVPRAPLIALHWANTRDVPVVQDDVPEKCIFGPIKRAFALSFRVYVVAGILGCVPAGLCVSQVLNWTAGIGAETVHRALEVRGIIGPRVLVPGPMSTIQAAREIVAALAEVTQVGDFRHGVPAHVVAGSDSPLEALYRALEGVRQGVVLLQHLPALLLRGVDLLRMLLQIPALLHHHHGSIVRPLQPRVSDPLPEVLHAGKKRRLAESVDFPVQRSQRRSRECSEVLALRFRRVGLISAVVVVEFVGSEVVSDLFGRLDDPGNFVSAAMAGARFRGGAFVCFHFIGGSFCDGVDCRHEWGVDVTEAANVK